MPPSSRQPAACLLFARPGSAWRRAGSALGVLAALAAAPGPAAAEDATPPRTPLPALPADCALAWQVELLPELLPDAPSRRLQVTMSFDGGTRPRSSLRLPAGWAAVDEGADLPASPRLQAVPEDPTLRRVAHPGGGRVQLRWRQTLPGNPAWWLFSGQAVLPLPDELDDRPPAMACIAMAAPSAAPTHTWLSSHGQATGPTVLWRLPAGPDSLRSRVQQALYAGGAWQVQAQGVDGQSLTVAQPDGPAPAMTLAALAQAGSRALAAQRRHWGETRPGPPLMLWALPLPADLAPTGAWGSAWHQTALVQASAGAPLAEAALDGAVTQAFSRLWLLDRFGPLVQAGRDDEALRRWFSEGLADFLAHQALLREQRWSAADLASHYNRQIERWADRNPPGLNSADPAARDAAAARGEWLALQWHALLRGRGLPGLDAVMRPLLVPVAQARREGPISAPLATHRLLAALRARLGDLPLRELQRVLDRGEPAWVYADTLSACFQLSQAPVAPWRLGFDPGSLSSRVLRGVQADGPAAAAGLQDGMALLGHTLVPGDASQPVQLRLRGADGAERSVRYLPAGQPSRTLLRLQALPEGLQAPACQGWLGQGPEASQARRGAAPTGGDPVAAAGSTPARPLAAGKPGKKAGAKATRAGPRSGGKAAAKATGRGGGKTSSRRAGPPARRQA